jgi:hypothetical protein
MTQILSLTIMKRIQKVQLTRNVATNLKRRHEMGHKTITRLSYIYWLNVL